MEQISIKRVMPDEIDTLLQISRQTFKETFSAVNTEENMRQYLAEALNKEKLSAELAEQNSEFYFAVTNDRVIGYIKVNYGPAQTEIKDNNALEIERIYVLKEFLGKKVGQLLYDQAIRIAHRINADYVWLGVWEENPRAIRFYQKNGFIEFDKHIFRLGDDAQTDIMMKLKLNHN